MRFQKNTASILFLAFLFHIVSPIFLVQAQESTIIKRIRIPVSRSAIIEFENGSPKLQVTDHQMSVKFILGPNDSVSSITYSPYGEGGMDQKIYHLYTNHRLLEDISVYHAGARFYSPTTGTFIQPDMVEGPVRYSYGHNNPITFSDPTGNSAYAGGNEGGSNGGGDLEMSITSLGGKSRMTSPASVGATALPWDDDTHYREVSCDAGCLANSSLVIGSAVATGFGGAFLAAAQVGMTGVSAMSVMSPAAGGASLAAESSTAATASTFALRSLAIKVAKDFAEGAVIQLGMDSIISYAEDGKIAPIGELATSAAFGGFSQALSWGLLGPRSRLAGSLPRLLGGLGERQVVASVMSHLPAVALDSFIWKRYDGASYSSLFAAQGGSQAVVGGLNRLRPHLGAQVLLGLMTANIVSSWWGRVFNEKNTLIDSAYDSSKLAL